MKVIKRCKREPTTRRIKCNECTSILEVTREDVRQEEPGDGPYPGNLVFLCPVCHQSTRTSPALFVVPQERV